MRSITIALTTLALTILGACGGSDPAGPIDEPGAASQPVTVNVSPDGGVVASADGKSTVTLPPGALAQSAAITITPVSSPPGAEGLLPGTAIHLDPTGMTFSKPVDLEIQVGKDAVPSDVPLATLAIHRRTGDRWIRVRGSTIDPSRGVVRAPLESFSVYAVLFLGAPAEVETDGAEQSGTVAQLVAVPPSLLVRSTTGAALPGLQVTFTVTSGGGSVVVGSLITTDEEGRAGVESWILGSAPGTNTLEAVIEGVDTPVVFTAQAEVGPPSTVVIVAGQEQSAPSGAPVSVAPAVRVEDAQGNPLAGVEVSFSADRGGVIDPSRVSTDESGMAILSSWTLGEPGANSLTATVAGLPSVVFTAQALAAALDVTGTYRLRSVNGRGLPYRESSGLDVTVSGRLRLNASGTCSVRFVSHPVGDPTTRESQTISCTYRVDGTRFTATFSKWGTSVGTIDGEGLTFSNPEGTLVFRKV